MVLSELPLFLLIPLLNAYFMLRSESRRMSLSGGMLVVKDSGEVHYAGTPRIGIRHTVGGLAARGTWIRKNYLLDEIPGPIHTVIDVGANTGDFLLAFRDAELGFYAGIEPVPEDFAGLKKNCATRKSAQALNIAVGEKQGLLDMFISTAGADSSFIEPANGFTRIDKVPVETLDNLGKRLINEGSLVRPIDILKIEAEGFEPEILRGAEKFVQNCRWVVVDGGPERGPAKDTTIEECVNLLLRNRFRLYRINLADRKGVGLFVNEKFENENLP